MTAVLTERKIAEQIKSVEPTRVAVAYLGRDWEKYLPNVDRIEAVVVAPVLGTNPKAVEDLKRALARAHGGSGWERLHFLRPLHAKLYLGASAAVYGSANLTENGLSGERLVELCRLTADEAELTTLRVFMDEVLAKAKKAYSTDAQKEAGLSELRLQVNNNPIFADRRSTPAPRFEEYVGSPEQEFYISWWQSDDSIRFAGDALAKRSTIYDYLCLDRHDKVKAGRWVLCWEAAGGVNERPLRATERLSWMYVDEIIPNGVVATDDEDNPTYQNLAIQKKSGQPPTKPFEVENDERVGAAFKKCFEKNPKLARTLRSPRLDTSVKALPELMKAMRHELALEASLNSEGW